MSVVYKLYDSTGACVFELDSYESYINYFINVLRPAGKGTRYVYGCFNRLDHIYEYGMLVINHA